MGIFDHSIGYGAALILIALLIELAVGWPSALFARIRHPVVWMGALITLFEHRLNRSSYSIRRRHVFGTLSSVTVVALCTVVAIGVTKVLPNTLPGIMVEALLASSLLAARSLYEHVADVAKPLVNNDLAEARTTLAKIVGRNTAKLDKHEIAGAALESLAENASDGVIAPVFWGVLFGLPGLVAYKVINTLDSMIGHKTTRYKAYGAFAAHLDDVANWAPARITALLIWCCTRMKPTLRSIHDQAQHHRSPNAGWPESAMAFALGVKLSGPRQYETGISNEPWLNPEGGLPNKAALQLGLRLYRYVVALTGLVLLVILWAL